MKGITILVVIVLALIALMPALCMWLWNWLMPYLFGVPQIGYWQALGLMTLASLLFYRPSHK